MSATTFPPARSEIPDELTWDLSTIFSSLNDWEAAFADASTYPEKLASYKGRLRRSGKILLQYLKLSDEFEQVLNKLQCYASMLSDQDTANSANAALADRCLSLQSEVDEADSFYTPEMLIIKPDRLAKFIATTPGLELYCHHFDEINRLRPHVRSAEVQELLASTTMVSQGPSSIYASLVDADLQLPLLANDQGESVRLTESNYSVFLESKSREVRRSAFEAMFDTYKGLRNSVSAMYAAQVNLNIFAARASKYASSLDQALHNINVPVSVYDSLIATVHRNLPLLHHYLELRKRILKVEELYMYDLYVPMLDGIDGNIAYADAQETVLAALAPLGEEYVNKLRAGFAERWVDAMPNKGKTSGAYSGGCHGINPFILLNWQSNFDSMFTLAHEAGHSMHSHLSWSNQPFTYSEYTLFVAEVASTTNEALLAHYLLSKTTDPKMRLYIINTQIESIRTTLIRQTMFAEFERDAHARAESGEPLTPDLLSSTYRALTEKYYGAVVKIDDRTDIEWAGIPHFYDSFYVYQYAIGIAAAMALSRQINEEGAPAVERYLNFLKSGCSDYSITLLQRAGVDLSTPQPVQAAFDAFGQYLELFEKEYAQLK